MNIQDDTLFKLTETWAEHLGYYDGRIDLDITDLSTFTTDTCGLIAHAPLWGTKPGQEKTIPVAEVRKSLAQTFKWARAVRHNMHVAKHPENDELALFFVVKIRPKFLPFNIMTVPLLFFVTAKETDSGLRIDQVDEWAANSPNEAQKLLSENCGWTDSALLRPHRSFGAVS